MKILTETDHYAIVKVPGGDVGQENWDKVLESTLSTMEALVNDGFRPLHYLPRFSGWVCEKQINEQQAKITS